MKYSDVQRLKQDLLRRVNAEAAETRQDWLSAEARRLAKDTTLTGRLLTAFASQFLLHPFFETPLREGRARAKIVVETLTMIAEVNRRNQSFLRDAWISVGNFWSQHGDHASAMQAYRDALNGERDPDRRALALINMAKVHVAEGRLYDALAEIDRVSLNKITRLDLREALAMLQARTFLTLGYAEEASRILKSTRGKTILNSRVDLERRYLALMARLDFSASDAFQKRADDFLAWAHAHYGERVTSFYQLEMMLLQAAMGSKAIRNRGRFMTRARYLAGKAGDQDLYSLLKSLNRSSRVTDTSIDALETFATTANHVLYQLVAVFLLRRVVYSRQFETAIAILRQLERHHGALRAGFTPKARRRFSQLPDRTAEQMGAALQAMPPLFQKAVERVDDWIFRS